MGEREMRRQTACRFEYIRHRGPNAPPGREFVQCPDCGAWEVGCDCSVRKCIQCSHIYCTYCGDSLHHDPFMSHYNPRRQCDTARNIWEHLRTHSTFKCICLTLKSLVVTLLLIPMLIPMIFYIIYDTMRYCINTGSATNCGDEMVLPTFLEALEEGDFHDFENGSYGDHEPNVTPPGSHESLAEEDGNAGHPQGDIGEDVIDGGPVNEQAYARMMNDLDLVVRQGNPPSRQLYTVDKDDPAEDRESACSSEDTDSSGESLLRHTVVNPSNAFMHNTLISQDFSSPAGQTYYDTDGMTGYQKLRQSITIDTAYNTCDEVNLDDGLDYSDALDDLGTTATVSLVLGSVRKTKQKLLQSVMYMLQTTAENREDPVQFTGRIPSGNSEQRTMTTVV